MKRRRGSESVVLLVPGFPGSEAETDCLPAVQNFVKAIAARNPAVSFHVVSFQYPFKDGRYTWNGVQVHALAGANRRFPLRFRTWFRAAWQVWRLIRSHRVVVLHTFWLAECTYVGSWLARATGTKHVATLCGQDALGANPYLRHLSFKGMTITAGSDGAARAFYENTGRRVDRIIPTGLDPEARRRRQEISERAIDILGVGSLSPVKDFRSFIEIIFELVADFPALKCMIIGEGAERPSLEQQIRERGLQHVVQLAGHLPRPEVLNSMCKARFLLHTSRYEGQGYVFLEALASGMRVVCRDVGYTPGGSGAYRCKSNKEMVDVLKLLLVSPPDNPQVDVDSIDSTACAFETVYAIQSSISAT